MPGEFWLQFARVIGEGQLDDPTPPGWPLWRTTYLCTTSRLRMLLKWPWISRCGDYWQQVELRTDGAWRIMMMMMMIARYPRRDGHAELTWVAAYILRWFTHLQMLTHPTTNRARRWSTLLMWQTTLQTEPNSQAQLTVEYVVVLTASLLGQSTSSWKMPFLENY